MEHEASSIEGAFFSMDDLSANMSGINHGRNVGKGTRQMRISFGEKGAKRGVCGATADQIVARNLLTLIVDGTTPHVEHAREVTQTLLEVAEGIAPYEIKGPDKLMKIAQGLGLTFDGKSINEVAKEVALIALQDFQKQKIHLAPQVSLQNLGCLFYLAIPEVNRINKASEYC
ncbi:hypothetical protein E4K67_14945 [Desulfosporosinus fructosivorans]|uniref:Uncharacterized protein n=1 Tax=Desulfosporosinus fructosivorans TaxID=2018669 RepID=A0A4Z0R3L6_9FIRM|nr:hypothetical protein [Desulfosporosinus fructosivorans]TGE37174.1 hypothetical protein E4K67_14945 [Desulfosporosinus fructosivorans]